MADPSSLREVQMAFAAHIRDPDHVPVPSAIEERRMAIYRELFFNNIEAFLSNSYPVIRKLFGGQRWRALIRDFMIHHRAHTPLFPELPREFLQFIEHGREGATDDPPFLLELAHYEWVELALSIAEGSFSAPAVNEPQQLLEQSLVRSPLAWLLSYTYPVHQIGEAFRPEQPGPQATHLVVYRRADDKIKFMELNAVSARLLDFIGTTPGTGLGHLQTIAAELSLPADTIFVQRGLDILVDLSEREIIGLDPN